VAKEYSTLKELYKEASTQDFIVGNEKSKTNKWFTESGRGQPTG